MEFSIATLLANFTDDKLVAAKALEKKLDCQDEICLQKLSITLDVLEKIGIVVKERGKYRRVSEEGVIEAKLRCSSKGFCFAIQEEEGSEDIYIRESHLSNAWNGDRVLVRLTKEGSRRRSPEGEVRLILQRSKQSLLAQVKKTNTGFRAVPLDDRLLFEIELQPNNINLEEAIDHLIHVEILRYSLGQYPPIGRVVKILGSDAETASDIDLVCCKHDLPLNFSANTLAAAADIPSQIRKPELKQRLDLRSLYTITIEAKDKTERIEGSDSPLIENAFTLEKTADGRWQLGVHVTDVAHYISQDSALDREALKRGSCVYLGEKMLPMLPEAVIERCSLLPQSDRLAISVLITLDSNTGQLVDFEIHKSVIQVDHQLSLQAAQTILSSQSVALDHTNGQGDNNDSPTSPQPVVETLSQLSALSQALRLTRQERGSFELNLPQSLYPYDDEGVLGAFLVADSALEALVRELLVLANQVVASHLQMLGIPAVYRVQPAPDPEDVQEMLKLASNMGAELRVEQEEEVKPSDFKRFTEQFAQSPESEQVLTYQLEETLKPPIYAATPQPYFGLALEQGYTHCNHPLQRYADLLIQRVLHTLFEQGRDRRTTRAKERVNLHHSSAHGKINWNVLPPEAQQELETDIAKAIVQLNDREKEVQDAEEDLAGLQKAQLMKQRTGDVFQGLITGVQSYGFFVEIEVPAADGRLLRVEGLVHVSSLKDDWYEYRARQQALFGRKNRASYRLGDRVAVRVKSVDYYRQQIDLVTVNGDFQMYGEDTEHNYTNSIEPSDSESYSDEE